MSKVFFAFVFGLAVCAPLATTANAQSRFGPAEDDALAEAASSTPAKGETKTETPEAKGKAKSTQKNDPRQNEPNGDAAKGDAAKGDGGKSSSLKTPTVLTSSSARDPKTPTSATTNIRTSDGAQKTTVTPLPVFGSPSLPGLPALPSYDPPAPLKTAAPATATVAATDAAAAPLPPTALYRVGAGDILDIRLAGGMAKDSTLYTVMSTGMLDYPLAGEPFNAAGLTTDEIGARLSTELRRRGVYDRAQFRIAVREYASHTATVSGLVDQPGAKILRREAVPLYVVLSEANPRAEAGRAVIISRASGRSKTVDLADPGALNELVTHGDIINIQSRPQEFFYVGGQINAPGQKDFHPGLTLTQAILASGGVARVAGNKVKVTVSRQGADGRLVATEYLLNKIETGQVPDPRLQVGDRVEIGRRR